MDPSDLLHVYLILGMPLGRELFLFLKKFSGFGSLTGLLHLFFFLEVKHLIGYLGIDWQDLLEVI